MANQDNPLVKIVSGISGWLNMLTGKPRKSSLEVQPKSEDVKTQAKKDSSKLSELSNELVEVSPEELQEEEDSVAKDIKNFKEFVKKKLGVFKKQVTPTLSKASGAVSSTSKKVSFSWAFKVLPILLIFIVILTAASFAISVFKNGQENGGNGGGAVVTPTPVSYQPYVPSIYAQDPDVLRIEEDLNVLAREISTTVLKESDLNPPQLDFNIRF